MSTPAHIVERLDRPAPESWPTWSRALRDRAREGFLAHGLPHSRLEDWKYTSLAGLADGVLDTIGPGEGDGASMRAPVIEHRVLRLEDGRPVDSGPEWPEGVELRPLSEALAEPDEALRGMLEALNTQHPAQAMTALNTADLRHGLVLRVSEGVDAGRLVLAWRSTTQGAAALHNARLLVSLAPGARLDLVEDFSVAGALNVIHQVSLGERSLLRHARMQANPAASWLITRIELAQSADSRFEHTSLDLGLGLARHDVRCCLAESGARCDLAGAYLPTGKAHVDHHLDVRHEAPGCGSSQTYRGVLHDEGRAVFNGRVHVLPGADDSEAHQSNQNLLLSRNAEVDTKPELIIEADEVVASHGATVGQLDELAVFYLRSRGIEESAARRMLTGAFCRSVVECIEDEIVREAFMARLDDHLEQDR